MLDKEWRWIETMICWVQAAEFLRAKLWDPHTKRLKRSYRSGPSDVPGFDTDYAFLISGLLDLYGATADTQWLAWAKELQTSMDALFWDSDNGAEVSLSGSKCSLTNMCCQEYKCAHAGKQCF